MPSAKSYKSVALSITAYWPWWAIPKGTAAVAVSALEMPPSPLNTLATGRVLVTGIGYNDGRCALLIAEELAS